jgi:hypothetical protein
MSPSWEGAATPTQLSDRKRHFGVVTISMESLILAQDERWRRA